MRTTVTLEPDVEALLRKLMRERGFSFKQALNHAIRSGLVTEGTRFETPTRDMGAPLVPLDKALELAAALEDEEVLRKLAVRK